MAYGGKIYGSDGDLVIDDTFETYAYIGTYYGTWTGDSRGPFAAGSSTITDAAFLPAYHNWTVDITSTSRPLVFYKLPDGRHNVEYMQDLNPYFSHMQVPGIAMTALQNVSGNTWRAYFVTPWSGGASPVVKAFVSTKTLGLSAESFGMRIKNANGVLVFDSGWKILNPRPVNIYMPRMQVNVSNTVGTAITFDGSNSSTGMSNDVAITNSVWLSAFTREPTITTYLSGQTPLYYTVAMRVFSGWNAAYFYNWPATINYSSWPTYNICFGSNQDITVTGLYAYNLEDYFT